MPGPVPPVPPPIYVKPGESAGISFPGMPTAENPHIDPDVPQVPYPDVPRYSGTDHSVTWSSPVEYSSKEAQSKAFSEAKADYIKKNPHYQDVGSGSHDVFMDWSNRWYQDHPVVPDPDYFDDFGGVTYYKNKEDLMLAARDAFERHARIHKGWSPDQVKEWQDEWYKRNSYIHTGPVTQPSEDNRTTPAPAPSQPVSTPAEVDVSDPGKRRGPKDNYEIPPKYYDTVADLLKDWYPARDEWKATHPNAGEGAYDTFSANYASTHQLSPNHKLPSIGSDPKQTQSTATTRKRKSTMSTHSTGAEDVPAEEVGVGQTAVNTHPPPSRPTGHTASWIPRADHTAVHPNLATAEYRGNAFYGNTPSMAENGKIPLDVPFQPINPLQGRYARHNQSSGIVEGERNYRYPHNSRMYDLHPTRPHDFAVWNNNKNNELLDRSDDRTVDSLWTGPRKAAPKGLLQPLNPTPHGAMDHSLQEAYQHNHIFMPYEAGHALGGMHMDSTHDTLCTGRDINEQMVEPGMSYDPFRHTAPRHHETGVSVGHMRGMAALDRPHMAQRGQHKAAKSNYMQSLGKTHQGK